jgi:plastocyanin
LFYFSDGYNINEMNMVCIGKYLPDSATYPEENDFMFRMKYISAALLSLVVAASADAQTGSIKGKIILGGAGPKLAPVVAKGDSAVKDPAVCAVEEIPNEGLVTNGSAVSNVVVYLNSPTAKNAEMEAALVAKTGTIEIDQKNCKFVPHVSAMHSKQKLTFKSSDSVNHNVRYSAFSNQPFNQILAPYAKTMPLTLVPERRPLPLACDIHPWMKGFLMVFNHPFFVVTGADGTFEIKGIPAGKHKFVAWQESAGYITAGAAAGQEVEVKAGEATDVGEVKIDVAKLRIQK